MEDLGKQALLLYAANLTLPKVIAVNGNLGCADCRDRVTQLLSRMTGLKEFTVDVSRKHVVLKGDLRYHKARQEDVSKREMANSSILQAIFKFLISCFSSLRVSGCWSGGSN
ncbi:hypothetical protein BUALT_Bualt05G0075400 [Buddleja alternifolia]|uniref:HMA domain-containing protein n=1 Tax=Buddleja alternifolia TaxID=168488 RepID=A0AAV6XT92_9LAMI|nr:hypothetical protein BUALT_Bualt05G0075400 [Buddleja alternifolia]